MTVRDQFLGGRYRLVRQVGEGGMGQVWEAQDETLGRPVAVKVISLLSGGGSLGDEARARFLREARITAQLQHPNIVTIHDLGETGVGNERVPFLVMELVRGEGLDTMLRKGVVTLPDAARWGAQIGDALADAHNAGIMHRDIKPSNILITPSRTVKVLDFGIARAADPYVTADRLTQTGFIVGTPPYMAPEQARGFPEPRSDLYALGCVLFELITGRLPFQAPDTVGFLTAHLTQEPPVPSLVATGIPPAWDDLVLALLRKEPDKRYPNAADLAQALRQLDPALEPAPPAGQPTPPATVPETMTAFGMSVDDVFSITGRGTVVVGRIECGVIKVNEEVDLVGTKEKPSKATVTGVEMSRKRVDVGQAGDKVGLLLRGIEGKQVERGMVVVKPGLPESAAVDHRGQLLGVHCDSAPAPRRDDG
ncbi:protein kinase [Streptomyces sp. NPDC058686]|uniref:protein kinase domain-containing protein n=1 Tax=Streptomyces sp. NPDC058686 TaxID=3346599 RepID=UPI0036583E20